MVESAIISALTTLLPLVLGISFWKRLTLPIKLVVLYCLLSILCDLIGIRLALLGANNAIVGSVFALGQLIILSLYFTYIFTGKLINHRLWPIQMISILSLSGYALLLHDINNHVIALRTMGIVSLMIIIMCLGSFYRFLVRLHVPRIELDPHFWIVSGILLHLTSCVILSLSPDLVSIKSFATLWFYFKNIMQGVMNGLLSVGLFMAIKRPVYARE